jgi:hypothetical protein
LIPIFFLYGGIGYERTGNLTPSSFQFLSTLRSEPLFTLKSYSGGVGTTPVVETR